MKRVRFNDSAYRVSRVYDMTATNRGDREGVVVTPLGYVKVYASEVAMSPDGWGPATGLWFIWRGVEYQRRFNTRFSRGGIVRVAARFAREIARRFK